MALLNRPMTEDEARQMLVSYRNGTGIFVHDHFWQLYKEAMENPTPCKVVYDGTHYHYITPDRFYFGPTVSTWDIPNTAKTSALYVQTIGRGRRYV